VTDPVGDAARRTRARLKWLGILVVAALAVLVVVLLLRRASVETVRAPAVEPTAAANDYLSYERAHAGRAEARVAGDEAAYDAYKAARDDRAPPAPAAPPAKRP